MAGGVTDPTAAADDGFLDFFRRYAKTWVHAVAAAGLTAFSTLTVVHTWFAGLAIAAYVVPPIALYLSQRGRGQTASEPGAATESVLEADEASRPDDGVGTREAANTGEESSVDDAGDDAVEWTTADAPVDVTLYDVAVTPTAAYAVGESGVVVADRGEGWTVALEDGPGADAQTLRGLDATAEGGAVWLAGDGGSLARIDVETGLHVDFSAPEDITDNWVDVAVGGDGSETVLVVNGSGEAVRGRYRDGEVAWTGPKKPGSGSSFSGVDFAGEGAGYLCDTNNGVYETAEGGETFERVGIDGADGTLTGIATLARDDCQVCADDGVVHRYDGSRWTPESVGDDALQAIAGDGSDVVACGEGTVYERRSAAGDWDGSTVPVSGALRGVGVGVDRAIAVGDSGEIIVRRLPSR